MIHAAIYRPGLISPRYIPMVDWSISRLVGDVGQFSISVDKNDLKSAGISNPINRWVEIDGIGDSSPFFGVIRDYNVSAGESVVELSGASIEIILSDRAIASMPTSSRPAGTIASQLLRNTLGGDGIPVCERRIDESTLPITWDSQSQNLFDAIQDVAQQSDCEWMLEYNGIGGFDFVFQKRLGSDKSRNVVLYETEQIISGSFSYTVEGMANSIVASGTRALDGAAPLTVTVNDWKSIAQYGRIQSRKNYYGMLSKASLYSYARNDLYRESNPLSGISFSCTTSDWSSRNINIGDTISIVVYGMSKITPCRIVAYSIDSDGIVEVTANEEPYALISESL